MRAFEFITNLFELRKPKPGQTVDNNYKGWVIRYEMAPKEGTKEVRGFAYIERGKTSLRLPKDGFFTGNSADDLLNKIQADIDNYRGTQTIGGNDQEQDINKINRVTIFFNTHLARDIIGHGDAIYADIIDHSGTPLLLLSTEDPGGFYMASDRTAVASRHADRIGQQAFVMPAHKAIDAGLTLSRYGFGKPVHYMEGIIALPLEFRSDVYAGERLRLDEPGLTVSPPEMGRQLGEETCSECGQGWSEHDYQIDEAGKASRALCKSSRSNADLGASQLASCKSQGLRGRETSKKHTIGNKRVKIKGKHVKGHKYGGPLPYNKSDN